MLAKLIALIVPLGLDTFAVAAALAMAGLDPSRRVRVSLLMTGFEGGMPLIGLAIGAPLGHTIGSAADYVAIGVLLTFGLYTVVSGEDKEQDKLDQFAGIGGWPAVLLGLSISLDELAVGFTFGLLRLPVLPVIILIAVQAFVLAQVGMRVGGRLSERARESAERLAGIALVLLGAVLLVEKLAA
ncbi:MAG: manganese efflux pump MntP [Solirubrobacteraceae bacterium]